MKKFAQYLSQKSGNVALMVGLAAVPLVAVAGLAIDFAVVSYAKTNADAAADSAILSALSAAETAYLENNDQWESQGISTGQAVFAQNLKIEGFVSTRPAAISIKRNGGTFEAKLKYDFNYPTMLMHLVNADNVRLINEVSAAVGGKTFVSVHLVIDNSSSMGIAATPADQQKMLADAGMYKCAFACHFNESGRDAAGNVKNGKSSSVERARQIGAKIRIDIVKESVASFLQEVKAQFGSGKQVEVSLHTFGNTFETLQKPTTDLDKAIERSDEIELTNSFKLGGTNLRNSLEKLASDLPKGGDGSTAGKRMSYVVVLTDGVEDNTLLVEDALNPGRGLYQLEQLPTFEANPDRSWRFNGGNITLQAPPATACNPLKAEGHTVMVAQIAYLRPEISDDDKNRPYVKARFDEVEYNIMPRLADVFGKCASRPEYHFFAADSHEVGPAFDEILKVVRGSAALRLTQ